jgi:endonuclease/exonuclease/phosphatase family metal-dependent hydrolase
MNFRFLSAFALLGFLGIVSCQRNRSLDSPRPIPTRSDGVLELRLMSFNVRYENATDSAARSWQQRIVGAVRMIHRQQPDILGVQEAQHGQVADLWASLPKYNFYGLGRDDGQRAGEYSGIFYDRDRFQSDTTEQGVFWLSDQPGIAGSRTWGNEIPRIVTWLHLMDRATGRGFYVFNTHWDHKHQASREKSALLI